jgi:crossover junction endodeoxyribonuclease RusA
MILESVTIVLPLPSKVLSPNCAVATTGGRFAKAAAIKRYRKITKEAIESECIDTAPWNKALVEATFFHKDNRRRDQDNAMGSLKAVYDGIVDGGLIPDDTPEHMKRAEPRLLVDKKCPRVMLEITRIS